MARLIYSMVTSLDGYAEAADGGLGAGADDQEVHTFIADLFRPVGTYLYGRRMYETMVYWETAHTEPYQPPHILQYARDWQAADKVVYSTTLESTSSARTSIERAFDPDAVRRLRQEARLLRIGDTEHAVGRARLVRVLGQPDAFRAEAPRDLLQEALEGRHRDRLAMAALLGRRRRAGREGVRMMRVRVQSRARGAHVADEGDG